MIALVYVMLLIGVISFLFSLVKSDLKEQPNANANQEASPEEMPKPAYRPFKDGPFQMTMGLRSLEPHQWIEIDPSYRDQLRLKEALLQSPRREELFIVNAEAYAPSREILEMLIDYLPSQFPNMFQRNASRTTINNLITGQTSDLNASDARHPLEIASLLVQEDLVVMQLNETEQSYHANGLAVCFPSGWLPKRKFGLALADIHLGHVPFFEEKLRKSMDRYFLKLKVDAPVQRANWILQIGNNLCHTDMDDVDDGVITKESAGERMYLRVERQTLRRLPKTNAILFTIKTYTTRMDEVCRDGPETAQRLAGALRNWPPEMLRYKGAHQYKEGLLGYLDEISLS